MPFKTNSRSEFESRTFPLLEKEGWLRRRRRRGGQFGDSFHANRPPGRFAQPLLFKEGKSTHHTLFIDRGRRLVVIVIAAVFVLVIREQLTRVDKADRMK